MASKISPLVHIEIVVRDAEEAYRFLNRVFGADKTQVGFARFLDGPVNRVVHVELGGAVLQFIEPLMEGTLWSEFLKEKGPGVHNLTFVVPDMKKAVEALEKEGAPVLLTFPLNWAEFNKLLPPDIKFTMDTPPVHMVGSEEKVGFRLELGELAAWRDIKPSDIK
jgi:catechol 2,3-dioxygenase-like lactoylglutathione lyase family enzyme